MIVKSKAVGIGADGLRAHAVSGRLADPGIVVLANTAVFVVSRGRAGAVARREGWPPNLVVRVREDAIARLGGRESEIWPGTPVSNAVVRLIQLPRDGIRRVRVDGACLIRSE